MLFAFVFFRVKRENNEMEHQSTGEMTRNGWKHKDLALMCWHVEGYRLGCLRLVIKLTFSFTYRRIVQKKNIVFPYNWIMYI